MKPILKEQAVAMFGSVRALADALSVEPQAIYQWPDGQPIPEKRQLQLRYEILPKMHMAPTATDQSAA